MLSVAAAQTAAPHPLVPVPTPTHASTPTPQFAGAVTAMPAVNKATAGTPEDDFGVPNFETCPAHAVLKVARDLAAAAAQTSVPLDRQQIAAQQTV